MRRFTPQYAQDLSIERLGDYADGVTAALQSRPTLAHLAPAWEALLGRADELEARKKKARRRLNRARVRYWVRDGDLDRVVRALSTEAYHLAGKDDAAEPYVSLFGAVTAEDVIAFGEEKAVAFARKAVAHRDQVLATIASDAARQTVGGLLDELDASGLAVAEAGDEREAASVELDAFDIARRQLIREAIALVADTEIGILTAHKGRRDLVDRVLALDFERTRAPRKQDEPAPTPA